MDRTMNLKAPGWMDEFRAFILRGNVVDLAIGIIIGAAFTAIVGSLVPVMTPTLPCAHTPTEGL